MSLVYRTIFFVLIWGIVSPLSARADSQPRVAVLELTGSADMDTLSALSDKVREGVLSAADGRQIIVMSRENMAVIAKDMGKDLSCLEGACEVETGRNLGADYVVSGRVITLEGTWITTIKIHETKGGALLASGDVKEKSALSLFDKIVPLANRLMTDALRGLPKTGTPSAGPAPPVGPSAMPGTLKDKRDWDFDMNQGAAKIVAKFTSTPPGAVVRLDGKLLCQQAPCSKAVTPGRHRVTMEQERYHPSEEVVVIKKGTPVNMSLKPTFGWLSVRTNQRGIKLKVGTRPTSAVPVSRLELEPGAYDITVDDPCYSGDGKRVIINEGQHAEVTLGVLPRMAGLDASAIDSADNDLVAQVHVDGKSLGETPLVKRIPMCSKRLVIRYGRARPHQETLSLRYAQTHTVRAEFNTNVGRTERTGNTSHRSTYSAVRRQQANVSEDKTSKTPRSYRRSGWGYTIDVAGPLFVRGKADVEPGDRNMEFTVRWLQFTNLSAPEGFIDVGWNIGGFSALYQSSVDPEWQPVVVSILDVDLLVAFNLSKHGRIVTSTGVGGGYLSCDNGTNSEDDPRTQQEIENGQECQDKVGRTIAGAVLWTNRIMWEIPGFDKTHARVFLGAQATWLNGATPLQEQWLFGPVLQWTYYWD